MKWIALALFLMPSSVFASGIFNPGSSGGSGTPGGSNGNVQYNSGGALGGASFFNVFASSATTSADTLWTTASVGPSLTDANGCIWRTTITTAGNLVTTQLSCPTIVTGRPCTSGMSLGLLLAITCSP